MNSKEIFEDYFNGQKNMVTPIILWYMYQDFGDETLFAEISLGSDFHDQQCFGATFLVKNAKDMFQRIDLDKFFPSLEELLRYVHSIDMNVVSNADRYGEPKHLYTIKNI